MVQGEEVREMDRGRARMRGVEERDGGGRRSEMEMGRGKRWRGDKEIDGKRRTCGEGRWRELEMGGGERWKGEEKRGERRR